MLNLFKNKRNGHSYEAPAGYECDCYHNPTKSNNWGSLGNWYERPSFRILTDQTIINETYKPKEWNRITIRARGNRLEHWINGVKVMDYVDKAPEASSKGAIGIQLHDGSVMKVECCNIRVRPLN